MSIDEYTQEEIEEMAKLADAVTQEILTEERWLKKLRGCNPGSVYPRLNPEWIDNHMGSIHSEVQHDLARGRHFRRVRGYNA